MNTANKRMGYFILLTIASASVFAVPRGRADDLETYVRGRAKKFTAFLWANEVEKALKFVDPAVVAKSERDDLVKILKGEFGIDNRHLPPPNSKENPLGRRFDSYGVVKVDFTNDGRTALVEIDLYYYLGGMKANDEGQAKIVKVTQRWSWKTDNWYLEP